MIQTIYIASSWKNEKLVGKLAEMLRQFGIEVYCFAERGEGQFHFNWSECTDSRDDGRTCLKTEQSKRAFANDKYFLDWANVCVLVNPCGRDAHLEAGYVKGKGGRLFILSEFPAGEFSNMYHLADGLYRFNELAEMVKAIRMEPALTVKGEK